ncbi:outer membrane beta-barrel protein [Flavobacterium mesophilum]|uniref:outer membrane beta-barrel protein n=1 Tax=Flavobacterium mesophilum TaxID=3143495 RepID=UPI0031DAA67B
MKIKILFFLLFLQFSFGQETENKSLVKFNHDIRVNLIIPSTFGDNFLAKASNDHVGIGANFSFLRIQNFKLGVGYDFMPYSTTDVSLAGNIKFSEYHTYYGDISYEIKILDKLNFEPYFGYGGTDLKFKSEDRSFGKQTGDNLRFGLNVDYQLAKRFSVFTGFCYLKSNLNINTAPEYVSFFDNAEMFQFNFGIKIH